MAGDQPRWHRPLLVATTDMVCSAAAEFVSMLNGLRHRWPVPDSTCCFELTEAIGAARKLSPERRLTVPACAFVGPRIESLPKVAFPAAEVAWLTPSHRVRRVMLLSWLFRSHPI